MLPSRHCAPRISRPSYDRRRKYSYERRRKYSCDRRRKYSCGTRAPASSNLSHSIAVKASPCLQFHKISRCLLHITRFKACSWVQEAPAAPYQQWGREMQLVTGSYVQVQRVQRDCRLPAMQERKKGPAHVLRIQRQGTKALIHVPTNLKRNHKMMLTKAMKTTVFAKTSKLR